MLNMYAIKAVQELAQQVMHIGASSTASSSLVVFGSNVNSDITMNNNSIINIKSISSANGKWSISEEGKIVAKELCLSDDIGTVCVKADDLRNANIGTRIDNAVVPVVTTPEPTAETCALNNQVLDNTTNPNTCINATTTPSNTSTNNTTSDPNTQTNNTITNNQNTSAPTADSCASEGKTLDTTVIPNVCI
jgi:hypothetical protein